jgi:hypothetical protein
MHFVPRTISEEHEIHSHRESNRESMTHTVRFKFDDHLNNSFVVLGPHLIAANILSSFIINLPSQIPKSRPVSDMAFMSFLSSESLSNLSLLTSVLSLWSFGNGAVEMHRVIWETL